ncbi:Subunit of heteropentameric Replication factor C (RF-C) [Microbotryomycetes sp. JL201]|nr:Subunit of heteropentameric Replication factor C (RF-C) [Microbotryomycetes sp. JL201]
MSKDDIEMTDAPAAPRLDKGKGRDELATLELDAMPWVEKYRPVTLDDVVAHKDIISTIDQFISKNRVPHLLFYGPPGTGKTSTILAVARKIYGSEAVRRNNTLELNASDDRGIDVVREQIRNFASTRMTSNGQAGFKLIILDEADQMTQAAQGALRRIIEQYTRNPEVEKRLNHVVEQEKVNITEDGRQALLKLSRGDMRRVLNVVQACHAAFEQTDETAVYNCTGNPHPHDIDDIMKTMMNDSFETAFHRIVQIKAEKGLALQDILAAVYDYVATVVFSAATRVYLLDHLAQVEHRLSTGGSEKLQLTALLGATKQAIEMTK